MNYEYRIVAFIDILGFAGIIDRTVKENDDVPDQIALLHNLIIDANNILGADLDVSKTKILTQFSDSFVISFHAEEQDEVFHTIYYIQKLIMKFLNKGFLLRGGIAYGKLLHNDNVLFGPAMISAYRLESTTAFYPRIIMDKSIIELGSKYISESNSPTSFKEIMNEMVLIDEDGYLYVDYFLNMQSEFDELGYYYDYVRNLRSIIVSNIDSTNSSLKAKYGWLKTKHNQAISTCVVERDQAEFLIP